MSSRFVFCFSATCSFTSWPSVGPVDSSRTTVNVGTPGGIFGWSQQVVGAADCSLFGQATDSRASRPMAGIVTTLRGSAGARIRDLLEIGATGNGANNERDNWNGTTRN